MNTAQEYWTARALLEWQVEMGVDEAIQDQPVDRYALGDDLPKSAAPVAVSARPNRPDPAPELPPQPTAADQLAVAIFAAQIAASRATSIPDLAARLAGFDLCDLRKGAKNSVFADGSPSARVMIIGEAPGRDEDIAGRPFVGKAGILLDRMFAAIGLSRAATDRASALYVTCALPWRPDADRAPTASEIAMLTPFLRAHIDLAAPDFLVLMGNTPCQALLDRPGINRLRGQWDQALGRPCLPMMHPDHLLRNPDAKRDAWADLLSLQARLGGG